MLCVSLLLVLVTWCFRSSLQAETNVSSGQVNGTWATKSGNEFKILALGPQLLRIEFSGVFESKSPQGPMANTGVGSGTASIEGNTAIFKPDGAEEECKITLNFTKGKMFVSQSGVCGFGNRVTSEGIYRRISAAAPKFTSGEGD